MTCNSLTLNPKIGDWNIPESILKKLLTSQYFTRSVNDVSQQITGVYKRFTSSHIHN